MKPLAFLFILIVFGCNPGSDNKSESVEYSSLAYVQKEEFLLDPAEYSKKYESIKDPILLDVRTPDEFNAGAIEGSRNLDFYAEDFKSWLSEMDRDSTYFIYCRSGGRSGKTMQIMNEMGFKKVYDLKGGITAWKDAGMKVDKP